MTPEETRRYIEHRLGELGWNLHIGKAAYDKIFRFTEGQQDGTDQLCHKLLSLGALQDKREINDEVVSMAMTDLAPGRERKARGESRQGKEFDLASIEQLTAVLETKVAKGEIETEVPVLERPVRGGSGAAAARAPKPAPAPPKILVVDGSASARAACVKALANDFNIVAVDDGEQAWKTLLEQTDIELIIADTKVRGFETQELIKRVRTAMSPPHLVGIPIVVLAPAEEAGAKLRVLMAGANDFIGKDVDPSELRMRVIARHRLNKSVPRGTSSAPRNLDMPARAAPRIENGAAGGEAHVVRPEPAMTRPPREAAQARDASIHTLTAERRFPEPKAAAGGAGHESFVQHLYRVSSTTTITLSATVLLAFAIIVIVLIGRNDPPTRVAVPSSPPTTQASAPETNRAETSTAPTAADAPAAQPARPELMGPPPPPATAAAPTPKAPDPTAPSLTVPAPTKPNGSQGTATARADTQTETPKASAVKPEPSRPEAAKPDRAPTESLRAEPVPPESTTANARDTRTAVAPTVPAPAPQTAPARPNPPAAAEPNQRESTRETIATAPPITAAPAPPAAKITRDELTGFLRRFASVYEAGDLDQFLNLFSENARTNDRTGRRGIREDYEALFRATDLRRMRLGEINWEIDANQAYGWGDFDVTVKRATDQESYVYTGSLTFVVEKVDGRLRITRLYHGQRRAESG